VVPNPELIVKTVFSLQSTTDDQRRSKGAWGLLAINDATAEQMALDPSCALAATADALFLLRRCSADLPMAYQAKCDRAVREGIERVWATCLLPSGLWKQNSTDAGPTTGGVMARLVDASPLLEFRTTPTLAPPEMPAEVKAQQGMITVEWAAPAPNAVAVRLYLASAGLTPEMLTDKYLAGIIQKSTGDVRTMDPLAAVLAMRRVGRLQWGPRGFEEGGYSSWKLQQLPATLVTSLKGEPLMLPLPKEGVPMLLACAVNAYGECSRPVAITVVLEKPAEGAPAGADEPAAGAPADAPAAGSAPAPGAAEKKPAETAPAPGAAEKKPAETPAAAAW
jgi:hypothetical protein